jgi:hypothetical protein
MLFEAVHPLPKSGGVLIFAAGSDDPSKFFKKPPWDSFMSKI